jgi:glycosyltransferase involved in cell wall biosynthesis
MLAYACSPGRGSEAEQGWRRAIASAQYFDTWVLCKQTSYDDITRHLEERKQAIKGLHVYPVPPTKLGEFLKKIPGCWFLFYNLWQRKAFRVARRLHKEVLFDLVHHGNIHTFREPGYLWKLDIPFVWGPVGGTENYPWRFLFDNGIKPALSETVRAITNTVQLYCGYRIRRAARKAAAVLIANSVGLKDFHRVLGVKGVSMLDIGGHDIKENIRTDDNENWPLRLLWSGSFTHRKGLQLLIKALGNIRGSCSYELTILGDGPLCERWQRLARRLKIDDSCHWLGWIPYDRVVTYYDSADVLVFTSLRDTSGSVIAEALSRGLPIICLENNGAADVINNSCGIKVPVTTVQAVVDALGDAIRFLGGNREVLHGLRQGALTRARDYGWSRHADRLAAVYFQAIEKRERSSKPLKYDYDRGM